MEHAPIYFGREQAICDVQLALREQSRNGCAFVLIVGASGSGKSSLARAGVLAALTQDNLDTDVSAWRRAILPPGAQARDLCLALAEALAQETALPGLRLCEQSLPDLAAAFAKSPRAGHRATTETAAPQSGYGMPGAVLLCLLVDQLEDILSCANISREAANSFFKALHALARSGLVWVLATVRSDYYAHCQAFPELMAMKEGMGQYDLLPAKPSELQRMIEQPVWLAGLRYERRNESGCEVSLDQVIFNDAFAQSEALPLLEYLLRELYERRTDDGVLTFAAYHEIGGVEGAIGQRAEALFSSLTLPVQAALPDVLQQLITVSEDENDRVIRQHALLERVGNTPERKELVERLLQARLLIADRGAAQQAVVMVAHDALLQRWERVAEWIRDNREDLHARHRLEQDHAHWVAENSNPDFLLPAGKQLTDAQALVQQHAEWFSALVREYVSQSHRPFRQQKTSATKSTRWLPHHWQPSQMPSHKSERFPGRLNR